MYVCSNWLCEYGAGYTREVAYSQDKRSWEESNPRYAGLCLNCWNDRYELNSSTDLED